MTCDDGGRMTIEEFENMFWLFVVAGNETLRNGIPGGMIGLLQHPQVLDEVIRQPDVIPGAADEMLRWWTPVMIFRRTATCDTEIAGQPIAEGDFVALCYSSANRDESVFENPADR